MENSKVSLIILFNKIVNLISLLSVPLDQSIRPFDHVIADGAEGGQGSPLLPCVRQNSRRREKGHDVVRGQRKGGSAAGPILEFLQFKTEKERTVSSGLIKIFCFSIKSTTREIKIIHLSPLKRIARRAQRIA